MQHDAGKQQAEPRRVTQGGRDETGGAEVLTAEHANRPQLQRKRGRARSVSRCVPGAGRSARRVRP
jgi:hypothetical protein